METYHQKHPCCPKDQRQHHTESGVIYRYMWDRLECDEEFIGDPTRPPVERLKEYLRTPSHIYDHPYSKRLFTSVDNFSIVGRE